MKPPLLPSDATPPIAKSTEKIKDPFLRTLLVRAAMLLILGSSAWLVWWSVNRLTLANRELRQKTSEVSALADEVQQLERKTDPSEVALTEAQFQEAKELLFAGPEEYRRWEIILQEQATALQLDAIVQPGTTQLHTNTAHKVSLIPATIALEPTADSFSTNSAYQRVVSFTQMLQKPNRRIDLLELAVAGSSNSVRQAKAVVQIWSWEAKP